jgi:hypothetical protein
MVLSSSVSKLAYRSPSTPTVASLEEKPAVVMEAPLKSWGNIRDVALPEVKPNKNPRNEFDPLPEGATVLDWEEHTATLRGKVTAEQCCRTGCRLAFEEGELSIRVPVAKSERSKSRYALYHRECFPFPELLRAVLPMIVHDTVRITKIGEQSIRTENGLLAATPFESIRTYRSTRRAGIMV